MLEAAEISSIVQRLRQRLKDSNGKDKGGLSPIYAESVEHMERLAVHSQLDSDPSVLITKKFPSESDEEFEYRMDNYEPVTVPFWHLALGRLARIWNETNFTIKIENDNQTTPAHDYLFSDYPMHGSINSFFKSIVTQSKINDPNAAIVVRPKMIPATTADRTEPVAFVYHSDRVLDYVKDEYAVIELMEKSPVDNGMNKNAMEGIILEIYDENAIYRVMQTGRKTDYQFTVAEVYWQHDWGRLPVWKLKGNPKQREMREFYESYFSPAIPNLNKAIVLDSTLSGTENKCAYPIRSRIYQECDEPGCGQGCAKGYIVNGGTGEPGTCPACDGTGVKGGNISPLKDILINTDDSFQTAPPFPGIAYTSPSTEILGYLDEKVQRLIITGFAFINIAVTERPEGRTATEVKINLEDLFSFLLQISEELFDLEQNVIDAVLWMRYPTESIEAMITRPDEFTIRSSAELTKELAEAKQSGIPTPATQRILDEFMHKRFNDDPVVTRKLEIQAKTDAFIDLNQQELSVGIGNGSIELWQKKLHDNFWIYLEQEIEENPAFLEQDMPDIRTALVARAQAAALASQQRTGSNIADLANT